MINHYYRAYLAWGILIKVASKKDSTIRYKELGDKIGIHHRAIRFVLSIIQDYCIDHYYPPITILIGDINGIPGKGFTAWNRDNIEEGKNEVYKYKWAKVKNPFEFAMDGTDENEAISFLLHSPNKSADILSKIKSRGMAQIIFRKALLKAYNGRCSFCNVSVKSILQASHIIPWSCSNDSQKLDIRNGILLCANHHCLFDSGIILIDESYTINIKKEVIIKTESDKLIIASLENKRIKLPKNINLYPNVEYLKFHDNLFNPITSNF